MNNFKLSLGGGVAWVSLVIFLRKIETTCDSLNKIIPVLPDIAAVYHNSGDEGYVCRNNNGVLCLCKITRIYEQGAIVFISACCQSLRFSTLYDGLPIILNDSLV